MNRQSVIRGREYVPALWARAGDVVRAEPFDAIAIAIADIFGMPPGAG